MSQKLCARYTLGARYRSENTVITIPVINDLQPHNKRALGIIMTLIGNHGNCETCQPRCDG